MSDPLLQTTRRSNSTGNLVSVATDCRRERHGILQLFISQYRVDLAECRDTIDAELQYEVVNTGERLFLAAFGQVFFSEDVEAVAGDGSLEC